MQDIDFDELTADENYCHFYEGRPFTGVARERNPQGALIAEVPFVDGSKHGVVNEWYPSGQAKLTIDYRYNSPHGRYIEYSQSGKLVVEAEYESGVCLWRKRYDQDGRLVEDYNVESDESSL